MTGPPATSKNVDSAPYQKTPDVFKAEKDYEERIREYHHKRDERLRDRARKQEERRQELLDALSENKAIVISRNMQEIVEELEHKERRKDRILLEKRVLEQKQRAVQRQGDVQVDEYLEDRFEKAKKRYDEEYQRFKRERDAQRAERERIERGRKAKKEEEKRKWQEYEKRKQKRLEDKHHEAIRVGQQ